MATTPSPSAIVSGRKRDKEQYNAEDEALNQIAKEAEHRLAAKRAARAEARRIRMRELEKQKEEEEEREKEQQQQQRSILSDCSNDKPYRPIRGLDRLDRGSRKGSDVSEPDSMSTSSQADVRELKKQLSEADDRFNKAMVQNAQLDNEKSRLNYQVESLKDDLEELEESLCGVQKDLHERTRELTFTKRDLTECRQSVEYLKEQVTVRDRLIKEYGLILVGAGDNLQLIERVVSSSGDDTKGTTSPPTSTSHAPQHHKPLTTHTDVGASGDGQDEEEASLVCGPIALLSNESVQLLQQYGKGTLDSRLKEISEEMQDLTDRLRRVELDLDAEKEQHQITLKELPKATAMVNGAERDERLERLEKDYDRQISDLKFKVQKLDQDNNNLQANVTRLDSQVKRQKTNIEILEESETELKADKRKLTRELREAKSRVDELEQHSSFLQKRLDKMRLLNRQHLISSPASALAAQTMGTMTSVTGAAAASNASAVICDGGPPSSIDGSEGDNMSEASDTSSKN